MRIAFWILIVLLPLFSYSQNGITWPVKENETNMKKQNLILVHSFPTNSILLQGLSDFLSDYMNVYFIDLPGFNIDVPPLKKITFDNYSAYVEEKIKEINLDAYWLGGISFGFVVVNNIQPDEKCKGYIAMEPYINGSYLQFSSFNRRLYIGLFSVVNMLGMQDRIYDSWGFRKLLLKGNPQERIDIMLSTIDAVTFFKTANLIFRYNKKLKLQDKPYILIINKDDETIKSTEVINLFQKHKNVSIAYTTSAHYPEDISKEYFEKHVSKAEMDKILKVLNAE